MREISAKLFHEDDYKNKLKIKDSSNTSYIVDQIE